MPLCSTCALEKICSAKAGGKVNQLPVKEKILQKKNRFFSYFLFEYHGKILVNKRDGKDIWQSLFEFYLLESDELIQWDKNTINQWIEQQFGELQFDVTHISATQSQQLTHQKIRGQFVKINLKNLPLALKKYQWVDVKKLNELAFPKFINQYLEIDFLQTNLF
jgi:A/G-specific adenine glycosylase